MISSPSVSSWLATATSPTTWSPSSTTPPPASSCAKSAAAISLSTTCCWSISRPWGRATTRQRIDERNRFFDLLHHLWPIIWRWLTNPKSKIQNPKLNGWCSYDLLGRGDCLKTNTPGRSRTCDTRFRKPLLYPLSYGGENYTTAKKVTIGRD